MEIMHTDVRVKRVKMSLSPYHLSACKFFRHCEEKLLIGHPWNGQV